jgi:glycine/sarcosine N-methyltransferase
MPDDDTAAVRTPPGEPVSAVTFYDDLAATYAHQFPDWQASSDRQAATLNRYLEAVCPQRPGAVLDTACGIGTQAIGLARRGYQVHAADISPASIEQARRNAVAADVDIAFTVADFRDLSALPGGFDAAICCDNALPHLLTDADIHTALQNMKTQLRPGGLLLITTRDYDQARNDRTTAPPPRVYTDRDGHERIVVQLWHWQSYDRYDLRHLMLTRDGNTWHGTEFNVTYRAIIRAELTQLVRDVGLTDPQWHLPDVSGYYQPLMTARAPNPQRA